MRTPGSAPSAALRAPVSKVAASLTSMTVMAYGDESVRRRGVPEPVYLMGAYVHDTSQADPVAALSRFQHTRKLHWRDAKPKDKVAICQVIAAHGGKHLVIAAAPLEVGVREERARQRTLGMLLVLLEQDYGVTRLVLERRDRAQDDKDRAVCSVMTRSGAVSDAMVLEHAYGVAESRLWVPDQVVGAYGDALAGDRSAWSHLEARTRVERVNLS